MNNQSSYSNDGFSRRGKSNSDRWNAQPNNSRWSNGNEGGGGGGGVGGYQGYQKNTSRYNNRRNEDNPSSAGIACDWSVMTARNERTEKLVFHLNNTILL